MTAAPTALRRLLVLAALLALVGAAATTPEAAARSAARSSTCWKALITDWYDGRIDHAYPIHCYRDALKHLPQDVKTYSDAYDVISRALASAIRGKKHVNQNALIPPPGNNGGGSGPTGGSGPGGTGGKGGGGGGGGGGKGGGTSSSADNPGSPSNPGNGFLSVAVNHLGSNSPDSVPVPLLVLAGLAVLLVAAGGVGLAARRYTARRARP